MDSNLEIISGVSQGEPISVTSSVPETESIIKVTDNDFNVYPNVFLGMSVASLLLLLSFSVGIFLRLIRSSGS